MATTVDQGNDISLVKSTNGGVGEPKTSGDDHVAERAVLTPARAAKKGSNGIEGTKMFVSS